MKTLDKTNIPSAMDVGKRKTENISLTTKFNTLNTCSTAIQVKMPTIQQIQQRPQAQHSHSHSHSLSQILPYNVNIVSAVAL